MGNDPRIGDGRYVVRSHVGEYLSRGPAPMGAVPALWVKQQMYARRYPENAARDVACSLGAIPVRLVRTADVKGDDRKSSGEDHG